MLQGAARRRLNPQQQAANPVTFNRMIGSGLRQRPVLQGADHEAGKSKRRCGAFAGVLDVGPSGSDPEVGGHLRRLARHHTFEKEEMEIAIDRAYVFLNLLPQESTINIVNAVKCTGVSRVCLRSIKVGRDLREGGFRGWVFCPGHRRWGSNRKRYLRHHEGRIAKELEVSQRD
jgi:hypothetical protein